MRSDVCRELRVDAGGRGRALGSWGAAGGLLPEAEAEAQARPSAELGDALWDGGGWGFPLPASHAAPFGVRARDDMRRPKSRLSTLDGRAVLNPNPVPAKPSVQAGVSRFADSDSDSDSDSTVNPPTMRCSENGRTDMYMQVAYKYARVGQHPHFSKPSEICTVL